MNIDAPFRLVGQLLTDCFVRPHALKKFLGLYANMRSQVYPVGSLPSVSIFDIVPDAANHVVKIQNTFELPPFPPKSDKYALHETASLSMRETLYLAIFAQSIQAKRFLEVGTSFGETTLLFALNSPDDATITTLDIQTDNPTVGMKFRDTPEARKITMHLVSAEAYAKSGVPEKSFDMIFVDGDHSYAGVLHDSQLAMRLIRPGGIICWHDYWFMFRHDVVRALDELRAKGHPIQHLQNTTLAYMKA